MAESLRILTVTWSGDRDHFALLRDSLARSGLAGVGHDVIVQSEDLPLFEQYRADGVNLGKSDEFLPAAVERARRRARRWQQAAGRHGTRLLGSLARRVGWPGWVRYTGWHTQQLCKLAGVAASAADQVVIMDSDVVVTRHAARSDFAAGNRNICFSARQAAREVTGKTASWQLTAHRLFGRPLAGQTCLDSYFDTPFVMQPAAVREMLEWLEERYASPWWQVLVSLPPRGWSEFCIYKTWLRHVSDREVDWRGTELFGYLFDASDPERLAAEFRRLVATGKRRYVTIHSQSAGRQLWHPASYTDHIRACLRDDGQ